MSELLHDYDQPAERPVFLTVLCILTFIGSGWGFIGKSMEYFTATTQAAAILMAKEKANADLLRNGHTDKGSLFAKKIVNSLSVSPANIKKGAISGAAAAILCLAGGFLMWKLKRTGFFVYLAGTMVGII